MEGLRHRLLIIVTALAALSLSGAAAFTVRAMDVRRHLGSVRAGFGVVSELVADGAYAGYFMWTELYELAEAGDEAAVRSWLDEVPTSFRFVVRADLERGEPPSGSYAFETRGGRLFAVFPFEDSEASRRAPGFRAAVELDAAGILSAAQSESEFALASVGSPLAYGLLVTPTTPPLCAEDVSAAAALAGAAAFAAAAFSRRTRRFLLEARGLDAIIYLFENAESYSAHHSRRVAKLGLELGRALGYRGARLRDLHAAAMLHDIGKIAVSKDILVKPGALNEAEKAAMRSHAEAGARILGYFKELAHLAPVARAHHEKMDGSGYPDGLEGERIPLDARIIAVADIYEALTGDRPYRAANPPAAALAMMDGMSLDRVVLSALKSLCAAGHPATLPPAGGAAASAPQALQAPEHAGGVAQAGRR